MRGRFYSPAWHRFMNSDQGVDPNSINQFAYVCGNPLMHSDPSGYFDPDSGAGDNYRDSTWEHTQTTTTDEKGTKVTTDHWKYKDGTYIEKTSSSTYNKEIRGTIREESYKWSDIDPVTGEKFVHEDNTTGAIYFDDAKAAKAFEKRLQREMRNIRYVQATGIGFVTLEVSGLISLTKAISYCMGAGSGLGSLLLGDSDEDFYSNEDGSLTWHFTSPGHIDQGNRNFLYEHW